jgi:GH18 family chitinase
MVSKKINIIIISVMFLCKLNLFAGNSHDYYCRTRVTGYYPDYHVSKLPISQIRFDKFSHIVYFSISPKTDGSLDTSTINLNNQKQLITTAHAQNVKVSICVGGWGLSSGFSGMAANQSARSKFITNIIQFCTTNLLDGIDLDWEPVSSSTDKSNYTILIKELKTAMLPHNLQLTVAVAALGTEFNSPAISSIDRLHVMAYDMGTPHSSYNDSVNALEHWKNFGFDTKAILLGLPFYGRKADWTFYAYSTIINTWHPAPDVDEIDGIYFNGIDTIKMKTSYVVQNNYGGVMIWEIPEDINNDSSLLTAIADTLQEELPPDFNCENSIDFLDLNYFANHFLDFGCSSANAWCNNTDRDLTGDVQLSDFALFADYWLQNQS